jgi:hypothetical protein
MAIMHKRITETARSMKPRQVGCVFLTLFFALSSRAQAQEPMPEPIPSGVIVTPESFKALEAPVPCVQPWTVDFIFGLPTGFRLQRELLGNERTALLTEGFLGLEAIFPTAGAGLRARLMPFSGAHDCMQINPGLDAYVLANPFFNSGDTFFGGGPRAICVFAGDVDIIWQHAFSQRNSGELGVKLGAGESSATGRTVPVVGIFGGFRF